jgi:hypothetical protein
MSIKALARSLDPTSRRAPLGGLARMAIGYVPGGSTVMSVVDGVNKQKAAPAAKPAAAPLPAVPQAQPTTGGKVLAFVKRPLVLIGGAVVVVAALAWFIVRKST